MPSTFIIPDKTIIYMVLNNDYDISIIDYIENKHGKFLMSLDMYKEMYEKLILDLIDDGLMRDIWFRKLNAPLSRYFKLIDAICQKYDTTYDLFSEEIINKTTIIHSIISQNNPGISMFDTSLISLSYCLSTCLRISPIILTNDSDLLIFGQIISKYFGFGPAFMTMFEAINSLPENMTHKYIENYALKNYSNLELSTLIKKDEYFDALVDACTRSLIAFHPIIPNRATFDRITRKQKF